MWKPSSRPDAGGRAGARRPGLAEIAAARMVVRYVLTHPSNRGHRARALARMAGHQARSRLLRRRTMARLGARSRMWVDLHRSGASIVLYANPPDLPEMTTWRTALEPGALFVDVGANVGSYTLWAAELGAEVIALEPAADTFALLRENIDLNGYRVQAIQAAAGAACGVAGFTAGRDAANCLDPGGPVRTPVVTIDSVICERTVAGLKIDVEGFELDVLRGCAQALAQKRIRLIQLEWNEMSRFALGTDRRPVAELLAAYGYRLYRPDAAGRLMPAPDPGYGPDVFARPDDRC